MNLIAALILLASASDAFSEFGPQWSAGIRGMPDTAIIRIDCDSCLRISDSSIDGAGDLVRLFPRPVALFHASNRDWDVKPETPAPVEYPKKPELTEEERRACLDAAKSGIYRV